MHLEPLRGDDLLTTQAQGGWIQPEHRLPFVHDLTPSDLRPIVALASRPVFASEASP